VLGSLMGRKLVTTAGRKQVIGRPILYKTTKEFLLRFGLKDLNELPSIEEFEKMAGELAEQEEMDMPEARAEVEELERLGSLSEDGPVVQANLLEEKDVTEPQADGDSEDLEAKLPVDGRISGLDPTYDDGDDPSAEEGKIQEDEHGR
jgi:segregation and condensation protein B